MGNCDCVRAVERERDELRERLIAARADAETLAVALRRLRVNAARLCGPLDEDERDMEHAIHRVEVACGLADAALDAHAAVAGGGR